MVTVLCQDCAVMSRLKAHFRHWLISNVAIQAHIMHTRLIRPHLNVTKCLHGNFLAILQPCMDYVMYWFYPRELQPK